MAINQPVTVGHAAMQMEVFQLSTAQSISTTERPASSEKMGFALSYDKDLLQFISIYCLFVKGCTLAGLQEESADFCLSLVQPQPLGWGERERRMAVISNNKANIRSDHYSTSNRNN